MQNDKICKPSPCIISLNRKNLKIVIRDIRNLCGAYVWAVNEVYCVCALNLACGRIKTSKAGAFDYYIWKSITVLIQFRQVSTHRFYVECRI